MAQSSGIFGNVAIVGIGHTQFGRALNRHSLDLIVEAVSKALDDCGLRKDDIDGLASNSGWPGSTDLDAVAEILGLELNWYGQTWSHGRFCASALQWAAFVVHHGLANYVACVTSQGRGPRMVGGTNDSEGARETGGAYGQNPPYGMTSPGAGAALAARRYFHRYRATSEQLAAVPIAFRQHATLNPNAMMRQPLTLEAYMASRFICEPLRRADYCLVNDGATCVIVTTKARAKDLRQKPVYIRGMQGLRSGREEFVFAPRGLGILQQNEFEKKVQADELTIYQTSGLRPSDVDALYTYDAFSFLAWVTLERFGFCAPGEAPQFTQGGRIGLGGQLPMNTNGGLLSEAHMSGWNHQIEIVRQLRGEAGERQVNDIEIAMWANSYGDALLYSR